MIIMKIIIIIMTKIIFFIKTLPHNRSDGTAALVAIIVTERMENLKKNYGISPMLNVWC